MAKHQTYRLRLQSLNFISPVDKPAQETAKVVLIKRAGESPSLGFNRIVANVHKVDEELGLIFCWAFTSKIDGVPYEDLHGDVISEEEIVKVAAEFMQAGGAVDEMHDGVQTGTTVFAMPWTPEIAKAFLGIDTDTTGLMVAIKPADDVFAKFKDGSYTAVSIDGTGTREPIDGSEIMKRARLTSSVNGHAHLLDDSEEGGETTWQLSEGAESGHDHPWARLDDGTIKIGESEGHDHVLISTEKRAAPAAAEPEPTENPMTKTAEQHAAELATANDAIKKLEGAATVAKSETDILKSMASLTDVQKVHHATLDAEGQVAYLAKSADARQADVTKAAESDGVIFTSDAGEVYRKSDDPRTVAMAKRLDEESRLRKAAEAVTETNRIEKLADAYPNLPGERAVKLALVKATDAIPDETARKAAFEILAATNAEMATAMAELGTKASPVVKSANDALEAIVVAKMAASPGLQRMSAYEAAILENPEIYTQITTKPTS